MPRTEDRTPLLGLRFIRWRENPSVQQLVCCLASGCLLALGRMMKQRGRPFDPLLGARFVKAGWDITNTCGKHRARMSAGVQRSLMSGVQVLVSVFPDGGEGYVADVKPRIVRLVGMATWPLVDDAARLCTAWVPKARGVWQETRDALWAWAEPEFDTHPKAADESWLLTERVIGAAGYYI